MRTMLRTKDHNSMIAEQLEIGFAGCSKQMRRPRSRMSRAAWWFRRMHQVVNQALDWTPAPPRRPEQIYLALVKSR